MMRRVMMSLRAVSSLSWAVVLLKGKGLRNMPPTSQKRESRLPGLGRYFAGPTSWRYFGSFSSDLKYQASSWPEKALRWGFLA